MLLFFLLLFAIQSGRAHCSSLSERPRDRASHQRLGPLFRLLMPVGVWAHKPAQAISTYLLPVQLLQLPDMGAAVNAATARPTQRRHCTAVPVTMRPDRERTGEIDHNLPWRLLYSAASTPWRFAFFCELTRRPFGGEGQGLRHRPSPGGI